MSTVSLRDVHWFCDQRAVDRGEPGIRHSYLSSLATVLNHLSPSFDPVWLVGASAFAFRIWVNERFCPSAMSVFDWDTILPETLEQAGYRCRHIGRRMDDSAGSTAQLEEAHAAIREAMDQETPVVAWDVADAEWGVLTGYDKSSGAYTTLDFRGRTGSLPFGRLGRNGVNILSVIIPGAPNSRDREQAVQRSLRTAVEHAQQNEQLDRPEYQDGLPAYDLWAGLCNRWAMLIDAGRGDSIGRDIVAHANYLSEHVYSARCYARDYLQALARQDDDLSEAAAYYADVARLLTAVNQFFCCADEFDDPTAFRDVSAAIRAVRTVEKHGVGEIRRWLGAALPA